MLVVINVCRKLHCVGLLPATEEAPAGTHLRPTSSERNFSDLTLYSTWRTMSPFFCDTGSIVMSSRRNKSCILSLPSLTFPDISLSIITWFDTRSLLTNKSGSTLRLIELAWWFLLEGVAGTASKMGLLTTEYIEYSKGQFHFQQGRDIKFQVSELVSCWHR